MRPLHLTSAVLGLAFAASSAVAQEAPRRPSVETLERIIETRTPETRVAAPDHDRITARRIDIVDENGVIRMTLSGKTPAPIIDAITTIDSASIMVWLTPAMIDGRALAWDDSRFADPVHVVYPHHTPLSRFIIDEMVRHWPATAMVADTTR